MNAIVPTGGNGGGNPLVPNSMEAAMRLAEMMARGKLVPQHLHGSPGDCLMVIEQAMRWGMSPFAVGQCTSVISGKLMFEGKLVSAALHTSGILATRLEYEFTGSGADRAITARGTLKGEDKPRDFHLALKDAKTTNGMWTKQPDQQLVYAATRGWARRHTPEVMLGVYSPEEMEPATPRDTFTGTTIDVAPEGQPRDTARAIGDELPPSATSAAPPKRTLRQFIDDLEAKLATATTRDAVDALVYDPETDRAREVATNGAKERLEAVIKAAQDRTAPAAENAATGEADDDTFPGDRP